MPYNRLKVAHVITELSLGGAQENTLFTVENLDKDYFTPMLVYGPGGNLEKRTEDMPQTLYCLKSLGRNINPLRDLIAYKQLAAIFKKERPHVVHTHSSKAGILGRLAARAAGVPIIVHTVHGFGFNNEQSKGMRNLYINLERYCADVADAVVFVSKSNRMDALNLGIGNPDKHRLIRSGVDLNKFPANKTLASKKIRDEFNIPKNAKIVLSVGNLKPQKNPMDFIETASKILPSDPDAYFIFLGDGPLRKQVNKRVRELGMEKRCLFPGWRNDIADFMATSSVYMMTSLWEGLPRSVVEALLSGLPCVVYNTDGVSDIIIDDYNGFLVEQKNVTRMTEAVEYLLSDTNRCKKFAINAFNTDLREFDINAMVRTQEELYVDLLRAK